MIAALVAGGAVWPALLPVALAAGILCAVLHWLAARRPGVRTPADPAVAVLVLMTLVSLWITPLPSVTRVQAGRLLAGIVLFYAIANWARSLSRVRALANGLALVGLGLALAAPVSVDWMSGTKLLLVPEALYRRLPVLIGQGIHPNVMAGALVLLLPLVLALGAFAWPRLTRWERGLTVLSALAMLAILAIAKSRGALVALAAALVVLVALRWRRGWLAALGSMGALGLLVWQMGPGRVMDSLMATRAIGGLAGRLEVWSHGLAMIQDFPLTGSGMGTFQQVLNSMYPLVRTGANPDVTHAHNLFLQVAIDLGIPGLLAWLAVLVLVGLTSWRLYRRGRAIADGAISDGAVPAGAIAGGWLTGLAAGLLCSQVALTVHGLVDAVTWDTRPAVIVWAVWGLALASGNLFLRED